MGEFNDKLCDEKHSTISDILNKHEDRLNGHSTRLDKLEQNRERVDEKIDNLCRELRKLTDTLNWFIKIILGTFITGSIGLLFYFVQSRMHG